MSTDLHVVFGGGQVGRPLAERLALAGHQVRLVRRSLEAVTPGIELVRADASDLSACIAAARGASTVYHCLNPPYDTQQWRELVPRYLANLIAAAGKAGARLVVLDNVYMLGRPQGRALDEDSPLQPCSRKGEVRARAAEQLFAAHTRGDVVATAGRASDFYGPGGTMTGLGDYFWPRVLAGKRAYSPYPLDGVHTYHFIPDVAAGLMALGCADADAYGRPWMLPCAPATSLRGLVERLARVADVPLPVGQMPRWVLKAMALAMPLMGELDEMLYQWEEPFVIDDRRFRARFDIGPEDPDRAALATVEWARHHYHRPAGALVV